MCKETRRRQPDGRMLPALRGADDVIMLAGRALRDRYDALRPVTDVRIRR